MNRRCVAIVTASLATVLSGMAATAAEFSDGTIVISDNWCAPNNNGACFACNSGRMINRALCNNSYCDNMVYGCADPQPVNGAATQLIGGIATANEADPTKNWGWTSDEQGEWSTNAVCPAGYAMVGMFASGNYSDNVRARCQLVTRTGGWGGITLVISRSFSISDEAPYHNWFMAPYYWTSGASCHNSYCDNMFYWYTTFN